MSLRWKIALALATIACAATIVVGAISYRTTRERLFSEVDRSLLDIEPFIGERRLNPDSIPARGPLSQLDAQVVLTDGTVAQSTFTEPISVTDAERAVMGRARVDTFRTVDTVDGPYRVRSIGFQRGVVQIGRPLDEVNRVLGSLQTRTLLLVLLVGAAATGAGLWIAGRVTASLRRLTTAAEHVEATGSLDVAVGERGSDEVGRLSAAFDRMIAALARSKDDQRRLVQDAGHELRTPLTSLRTNLDTLRRYPDLGDDDRHAIVGDLHAETEELTDLVNEIIALASGELSDESAAPFDLAEVVADVAERFERRVNRRIEVLTEPTTVVAQRSGVQRAVSCMIDNACKFDPSGGPIEVSVRGGVVTVADRGPGIPESELEGIFDRFHRAEAARTLPGSGLGLSIVREVAQRHGGDAWARNRDGGGAEVAFRLVAAPA
ncbi:MAG: HAMP domain-containing sensor histidine kinase [Ilumatobacter sp.]|uniref:HAMP domain-containing sensor histidine kinase n=1 Tax=Ilumatobacter sp. TaxID=1967498 RepID=UPI0026073642|nr:HAMP domain-containing sensor histidine kinase [Ilumatobacter sp.]MDJ0770057.1 HAMP domain-containing sensor histidine kinase [Ilumatobacter sp.]